MSSIRDERSEQPPAEPPPEEPAPDEPGEGVVEGEDLPEEALADQPDGTPEDTPDGEVDGGGEPGDQHTWDG